MSGPTPTEVSRAFDAMAQSRNRLRPAREYVGFDIGDAASFVGVSVAMMHDWEAGRVAPTVNALDKLAKLYRRPADWLMGAPAPPVDVPPEIIQLIEDKELSSHDRQEVIGFVEWLQHGREA